MAIARVATRNLKCNYTGTYGRHQDITINENEKVVSCIIKKNDVYYRVKLVEYVYSCVFFLCEKHYSEHYSKKPSIISTNNKQSDII